MNNKFTIEIVKSKKKKLGDILFYAFCIGMFLALIWSIYFNAKIAKEERQALYEQKMQEIQTSDDLVTFLAEQFEQNNYIQGVVKDVFMDKSEELGGIIRMCEPLATPILRSA